MPASLPVKFSSLKIEGWRQFGQVEIELHPQLTVLTGANGAGKSTLLNILSSHFNYSRPLLGTPRVDSAGGYKFVSGILSLFSKLFSAPAPKTPGLVGKLVYTNNIAGSILVPVEGAISYTVSIENQQQVRGFHISSHRRLPQYQQVSQIPTQPMVPQQAYDNFNGEMMSSYQGGHSGFSSTYRIKEALISMALLGPKTEFNGGDPVLRATFAGFGEILKKILPEEIGFIEISIRSPDVVLITKSGEFLIDAVSGGLLALIDLAWQIYMYSVNNDSFVVTMDEPENHLHPSMQRLLMGNLVKTFPKVQFIVATHSPFIVSAVRDSRVYVLRHVENPKVNDEQTVASKQTRFVSSIRLDSSNRAGTASQILRDVLGLPTTYPEWVSEAVDGIINKYRGRPFDERLMTDLRRELNEQGYSELLPDVTSALAKG